MGYAITLEPDATGARRLIWPGRVGCAPPPPVPWRTGLPPFCAHSPAARNSEKEIAPRARIRCPLNALYSGKADDGVRYCFRVGAGGTAGAPAATGCTLSYRRTISLVMSIPGAAQRTGLCRGLTSRD